MPSARPASSAPDLSSAPDSVYALIGAFTYDAPGGASPGEAARGLALYDTTSVPWQALQVDATPNPSFMVMHPAGHLVYVVNEVTHHAGQPCGAIQVYRVESDPPQLCWITERALAPGATGPTHIAIDVQGRHLVVSAYTGGQFNLFELDAQGIPAQVCDVLAHEGLAHQGLAHSGLAYHGQDEGNSTHGEPTHQGSPSSPPVVPGRDPDRQQAPHAHQALCSPDGKLWVCCDLGADTLSLFRLQDARFVVLATHRTLPGAGPRHAAFHPTHPWVYVINELAVSLTGLRYDEAGLVPMQHESQTSSGTSLLPEALHGGCGGSALVMHPGGKWLYASTKGVNTDDPRADSVSAWSIDQRSGALSLLWRHTRDVKGARAMTMSADGSSLYVLNQTAGTVMHLDIDPQSGLLGAARIVALAPTPTCLTFLRRPRPLVA